MKKITSLFILSLLFLGQAIAQHPNPIYVSPTGSDTNGTGTSGAPLQTPYKAQSMVATWFPCSGTSHRTVPVTVLFKNGFYPLNNGTWTLTSADSGCSATLGTTYAAVNNGQATISGGVRLTMALVSGSLYKATNFPASITGESPEALYFNGTRRFRPRVGAISGFQLSGLVGTYLHIPNPLTGCTVAGSYNAFCYLPSELPIATINSWANYKTSSLNQINNCQESGSPQDGDIEILIFEKWTMAKQRIACIDKTKNIIYLTGSTPQNTNHGYFAGHRYIIENAETASGGLPSLLPGQFFIDRSTTPFTLYYEKQSGENPLQANIVLPVLPSPSTTSGAVLDASNLQFVTIQGLQFSHDNYAPPADGYGSIQSDTGLPSMVACLDCSNTTWNTDTFTQTTGHGLWFHTDQTAAATSNTIENSYFYDLGGGGLGFGDNPNPKGGDTDGNTLDQGLISNNLVQGYGRLYAGAAGIESPLSHNTKIENNDVTDGYNTGIGVCIPNGTTSGQENCGGIPGGTSGHDILGQQNHVWDIGKGVTDDMGAFYIATYSALNNQIVNNKLHDVVDAQVFDWDGYGGNGIYIDNITGNVTARQNLVYRVTGHTVQNTQGPDIAFCPEPNTIYDNILSQARIAMFSEGGIKTQTQPEACLTETLSTNIFYFDRVKSSPCGNGQNTGKCAFYMQSGFTVLNSNPTQAQIWEKNVYFNTIADFGSTSYVCPFYTYDSTASSNCALSSTERSYTFSNWKTMLGQDSGSVVTNPKFKQPSCIYPTAPQCEADTAQDDYSLPNGAPGDFIPFGLTFGRQCSGTCFSPSSPILDTFPTNVHSTRGTAIPIFSTELNDSNNNYAF
jgi:hypothetical protein